MNHVSLIHGAIDGYSRVLPYLKVARNNRSDTALSGFLLGVDRYGLPSRVHCDKGGENVLIAEYMVTHRVASFPGPEEEERAA